MVAICGNIVSDYVFEKVYAVIIIDSLHYPVS